MSFSFTGSAYYDSNTSNIVLGDGSNQSGEATLNLIPTDNFLARFMCYKASNDATPPEFVRFSWGDSTDRLKLTFNDTNTQLHLNSTLICQCNYALPYGSNNSIAVRTRLDTTKVYVGNSLLINTPTSNLNFNQGDFKYSSCNVGSNLVYVKYPSVQPIYTINTATEIVGSLKADYLNAPLIASSNVSSCNIEAINALAVYSSNNFANYIVNPTSNLFVQKAGDTMSGELVMSNTSRIQFGGTSGGRVEVFQTGGQGYIDYWSNLYFRCGSNTTGVSLSLTLTSNNEVHAQGKIREQNAYLETRYAPSNISSSVSYSSNALSNYSLTTHNHDAVYRKSADDVPWSQISGAPNWSSDSNGDALSVAGVVLGTLGLAFAGATLFNGQGQLVGDLMNSAADFGMDLVNKTFKGKGANYLEDAANGWIQSTTKQSLLRNSEEIFSVSSDGFVTSHSGIKTSPYSMYLSNDMVIWSHSNTSNMTLSSNMMLVQNSKDFTFSNTTSNNWIFSNGKVGIGTSNPALTLDVNNDAILRNNVIIASSSSAWNTTYLGDKSLRMRYSTWNGQNCAYIQSVGSNSFNKMSLQAKWITFCINGGDGSERMCIDSNGSVGINTTSPTQRLHVNGNITCSSNITASNLTTPNLLASSLLINSTYCNFNSNAVNCEIMTSSSYVALGNNAGGSNMYGKHFKLTCGNTTGSYWGSNPSVFGGDMVITAGSVHLNGNNGSAWCYGYGGNVKHYAGYAYVSTTDAGNNRYVESGRHQFYTALTNGISVDTSYIKAFEIDNLGNLVAYSNALIPYITCSNLACSNISVPSMTTPTLTASNFNASNISCETLSNVSLSTSNLVALSNVSTIITSSNITSSNLTSTSVSSSNVSTHDLNIGTCRIVQGALYLQDYSEYSSQYDADIFVY